MSEIPEYLDLYGASVSTAESAGITLSDSAAQYFMNHARNAVRRIKAGDLPVGIDPAESFLKLAHEVVQAQPGSHYGREGLKKAGSDTIEAALRKLCPLWPFCD